MYAAEEYAFIKRQSTLWIQSQGTSNTFFSKVTLGNIEKSTPIQFKGSLLTHFRLSETEIIH